MKSQERNTFINLAIAIALFIVGMVFLYFDISKRGMGYCFAISYATFLKVGADSLDLVSWQKWIIKGLGIGILVGLFILYYDELHSYFYS